LDPENITISDGATSDSGLVNSTDGTIALANGSGTETVNQQNLESVGATTNIILHASNSITINDLSDDLLDLQQTSGNSVLFKANNGAITFNDLSDEIRTQGGVIEFNAGGSLTLGKLNSNGGKITLTGVGVNIGGDILTGGKDFIVDAGTGAYNQHSNIIVTTAGDNAEITADTFNLLFGFTGSGGNIFGIPSSIVTGTFSFINGPSGGSITLLPKTPGKTICIATPGCNINLNQLEIISLKGKTLNVGALGPEFISKTGFIKFGDVDLGHKKTKFISGDDIFGIGSNIVVHNDFSLKAKENISFTSGSSIEAHVSGFNATFTALADSDRLNGGGFNLRASLEIDI
jgi:hypothetical protein